MTRRALLSMPLQKNDPRLVLARQLRNELQWLGYYCGCREDWDALKQNIREGAVHITYKPCHTVRGKVHMRVVAEWITVGQYGVESIQKR